MIVQELLTRLGFQVNTSQINNYNQQLQSVAQGAIAIGAGIATKLMSSFISVSAETFGKFEAELNQTKAVTGATTEEMAKLEKQALDLGSSTKFSASETATAQGELAKAGMTINQVLTATPGILSLAAAGNMAVGTSAELASGALNGFGLQANQAGMVADIFAKTANLSAVGLADIGETAKYAAPAFRSAGQSIGDFSTLTAIMGNNMIKGSMAGTALAGGMARLTSPPKEAANALKKYNIATHDSKGNMLNIIDLLINMKKKFKDATQQEKSAALTKIFGLEASRGFLAIMNTEEKEIRRVQSEMKNYNGAAEEMATIMNSGLLPVLDELQGTFETLFIKIGKQLAPALIVFARTIQTVINFINDMPPAVHKIIAFLSILGVILGTVLTGFLAYQLIAPILGAVYVAFLQLNVAIFAIPLAIIAIGLALYAVIEDLKVFAEGGDSLIGKWLKPFPKIKQGIFDLVKNIIAIFNSLKNSLNTLFSWFISNWATIGSVLGYIVPVIYLIVGALVAVIAVVAGLVGAFLIGSTAILAGVGYLILSIVGFFSYLITNWTSIWATIVAVLSSPLEFIKALINAAINQIVSFLMKLPSGMQDALINAYNYVKIFVSQIGSSFSNLISSIVADWGNAFTNLIPSFLSGLGSQVSNLASQIGNLLSGGINVSPTVGSGGGGGVKIGQVNNNVSVKVGGSNSSAGTIASASSKATGNGFKKALAKTAKNYGKGS